MSYNYNPLAAANQMPMMSHLHMPNGGAPPGAYMSAPSSATATSTMQQQIQLAALAATEYASGKQQHCTTSAPLSSNASSVSMGSIGQQQQAAGEGPMDLETAAESANPMQPHRQNLGRQTSTASGCDESIDKLVANSDVISHQQQQQSAATAAAQAAATAAMMFNSGMLLPQSLMMHMPGMMNMMDAATASTLLMHQQNMQQQQQYPTASILQQQQQLQAVAAVAASVVSPAASASLETSNTITGVSKEHIVCKSCTLIAPNPNAAPPTTRERPPGCRTVFVGGLPENTVEEHIRELFERCGEITTLRLSKKNFCHIRFVYETSVDSAIYLSGYRIRLGTPAVAAAAVAAAADSSAVASASDAANCGRLHVDFAQARDDQYEWECRQRQLQREQRHRDRCDGGSVERGAGGRQPSTSSSTSQNQHHRSHGSQSPPPVVHYTDHEAAAVAERLKQDEQHFLKAVQVLGVWLERGDCSKKNANQFYSMIQSTNAHVRRLQTERAGHEEEWQRAKEVYRKQMGGMCGQFSHIEKVFGAASHKKVWDHFTKAQRKNIDLWKKQSTEIRQSVLDDYADNADEMDMSDDESRFGGGRGGAAKRVKLDSQALQVENDTLRSELAAYRSDADMVKSMLELDTDVKEKQLKVLQETIRNLQTQLLENNAKERATATQIAELEARLKQSHVKELLLKTKIVEATTKAGQAASRCLGPGASGAESDDSDARKSMVEAAVSEPSPPPPPLAIAVRPEATIHPDEARIIGLVSTFLVVHPFGASLDYIYSYVQRASPLLRPKQLEEILGRYERTFSEEVTGVGAQIERRWRFCGFDVPASLPPPPAEG